jgi:hypothetical protein
LLTSLNKCKRFLLFTPKKEGINITREGSSMNTQKTKTYCFALAACLGAGLILAISLAANPTSNVLATGTDKSITVSGSDNLYVSADVLPYAANYNTDANFRTLTFDGHTFKSALLQNTLYSGTFTLGGTNVVVSSFNKYNHAGIWLTIGLQNIKSVSFVATGDSGTTLGTATCTTFDAGWNVRESYAASLDSQGQASFTISGSYVDDSSASKTYTPRWATLGISSSKKSSNANPYVAIKSYTLTWNC